jgi:hypothetical protein
MVSMPLQIINLGYAEKCKTGALIPPTAKVIGLYSSRIINQTGGAIDAAICRKFATADWKFYTLTAASTPDALDVTSTIQAGSSVNIFTAVNNGGYLVGAKNRFNGIGITATQAQSGSPVYTYQYFNGSAYADLVTIEIPNPYAVGTNLVMFQAPVDWAPGTTAAVGGDATLYNIKVLSSTAGGQAVIANAAWVVQFLEYQSNLEADGSLEFNVLDTDYPLLLSGNEQVLPYFGAADADNSIRLVYSIQP